MDINTAIKYESKVIDGVTHIYIINEIKVDKTDFEQRVKIVTVLQQKKLEWVARKFGLTQSSFLTRCRTGKMNFLEQHKLAEILGCEVVIKFTFDNGAEHTGSTAKELVVNACAYAKISQMELGERLGRSRQAFNSKLNTGRFTDVELMEIADKIGCTYFNYFKLDDGTQI